MDTVGLWEVEDCKRQPVAKGRDYVTDGVSYDRVSCTRYLERSHRDAFPPSTTT